MFTYEHFRCLYMIICVYHMWAWKMFICEHLDHIRCSYVNSWNVHIIWTYVHMWTLKCSHMVEKKMFTYQHSNVHICLSSIITYGTTYDHIWPYMIIPYMIIFPYMTTTYQHYRMWVHISTCFPMRWPTKCSLRRTLYVEHVYVKFICTYTYTFTCSLRSALYVKKRQSTWNHSTKCTLRRTLCRFLT